MTKKLAALAGLLVLLLAQRPQAQATAKIYFVDIGTGAGTLIVSPAGKTLLVDGGPPGAGTGKLIPTLDTLGIARLDYTVLTHYHIDHDGGLTEVFNAGRVAGGTAYDNGDAAGVIPPSLSGSTGQAYTAYKNAVAAGGATRATIAPGQVIDLGGGVTATCLVVGGRLLSGASVPITNDDLNSESISLLVQYNNFKFLVSGDLTGGGATSTEKSPDVETWVGQLAGDVDAVQLNHHGSLSASNSRFLRALKAEVAVAETGSANTFGHPNRETVNKYLNTPVTSGNTYAGTAQPPPGLAPVFYQIEQSSASDDRETQQGYFGAPVASAGAGTLLLETDGTTNFRMSSFDDGGARINPSAHVYPLGGGAAGVTADFPPTVIPVASPAAPLSTESVVISAQINDRESPIAHATLAYSVNGIAQAPVDMGPSGGLYVATIPAQPDGVRVDYTVTGATASQTTTYSSGYFSGVTAIATLRALTAAGEPLYQGYPARIQGLVTAGSNLFGAATYDDYVDDGTGAINIYRSTNGISTFSPTTTGQTIEAVGHIESLGGRFQLDLTDSVEKTSSAWHTTLLSNPAVTPVPAVVTIASLNAAPESYEGKLVTIHDVSITGGSIPATPQAIDAFAVVSDGTGSFVMKIDHSTDVEGFTPASVFTLTGIVQQDDFLRPFTANYDVAPRSRVDLGSAAPAPPPLLTIADARVDAVDNGDLSPTPDFVPDRLGQTVEVRGTVTSINFRPTGTEYYIQDATGGIDIFATSTPFGAFGIGTTVDAVGTVTQFNGLTELTVTSVTPTGSTTPVTPQLVTLSQLADGAGESLEGRLIRVDNVTITSGSYPLAGASGNLTIADATGSVTLRIDADTNIDGTATPAAGSTFTVIALASQFDAAAPFDSGYQILPRSLADIVITGSSAVSASPTSIDFGSVAIGGSAIRSVTITNAGVSTITLTPPFAITGTDAPHFLVGTPVATVLAPGGATSVSVTFTPTTAGAKTASLAITTSGVDSASVALTGTATGGGGGATAGVVISEFRTRGPSGGNDEFVELYNNSDAPIDIGGWKMKGSNSAGTTSTRATVPAGTSLPARKHYLFTNSAAGGYSGAVAGNTSYATGITDDGGIAITTAADAIVDQVGMSAGSAFKEGVPLAQTTSNLNQSYERLPGGANGSTQDTNANNLDFVLHNGTTTGTSDPQNLSSAPTGAIKVSPSAVDCGSVSAGGTATATVTVTNTSATSLAFTTPFALTGANAADFAVGSPAVSPLAGGASTTVTITFHPSTSGGKSATATIASPGGAPAVALTGVATAGISVNPVSIAFPSLDIGSSSTSSVTISNDDAANTVTLSTPFQITGPSASEFSVGIPADTTLGGGGSTSVVVGFSPASAGGKSATLSISSVAGSVRTVALTGSSACPAISIDGALTGGILQTAYSRSLVAGGGVAPYVFSIAGGSIPDGLTFSNTGTLAGIPTAASTFNFTVQAADAHGCSGTASYSVAILAASLVIAPSPADFGTVFLGSHGTLPVTITNTSAFPITLATPFGVTGADAAQFAAGAPAATTLGPGVSTTAQATFTPSTIGSKSATLTVTSSGGGVASAPLHGAGHFGPSVGSTLLISEFRTRGPAGASDEFVELYNNTLSSIDMSGYRLLASNSAGTNSTRAVVPAGTMLPPHGHYLLALSGSSTAAMANQTYSTGITDDGGIAIAMPDGITLFDQVGMSGGSAFSEGTTLAPLAGTVNQSYERRPGGVDGSTVDTNDNASDFVLVSPSDPQSLTSPPVPSLLGVSPSPQDFGSVALGASSSATITIANLSTTTVTLTPPFVVSGADASQFSVGAPASSSLGDSASTSLSVVFAPTTLGGKSALLTITGSGGTSSVSLSGMSVCPAISVTSSVPGGSYGSAYSGSVSASGGAVPYAFSAPGSGTLPPGLSFNSDGTIAGTSAQAGRYSFTVTAADANGCTGAADVRIDIAKAPLSVVTGSVTREFGAANPPLTGTLTGVVNGDPITAGFATTATAASPIGSYPIVPSLNDPAGRLPNYVVTSSNGTLTVVDTTAPSIVSVTPGIRSIWPPSRLMVAVPIAVTTHDAVDASPSCQVTGVSSNEPEAGDSAITGPLSVSLLANRRGSGSGRVYTIDVRCVDASGNAATASTAVTVPHDQGK